MTSEEFKILLAAICDNPYSDALTDKAAAEFDAVASSLESAQAEMERLKNCLEEIAACGFSSRSEDYMELPTVARDFLAGAEPSKVMSLIDEHVKAHDETRAKLRAAELQVDVGLKQFAFLLAEAMKRMCPHEGKCGGECPGAEFGKWAIRECIPSRFTAKQQPEPRSPYTPNTDFPGKPVMEKQEHVSAGPSDVDPMERAMPVVHNPKLCPGCDSTMHAGECETR